MAEVLQPACHSALLQLAATKARSSSACRHQEPWSSSKLHTSKSWMMNSSVAESMGFPYVMEGAEKPCSMSLQIAMACFPVLLLPMANESLSEYMKHRFFVVAGNNLACGVAVIFPNVKTKASPEP
eukprot:CAMPEP_0178373112 /NCGR_PEP_ID=MMETSP0689_2-20121128/1697_1 /TAXON_ID=160604 /ORGANISM="Amphidinium massartii, Strain CS-259" /LENGTH=125 /DNA_ID=CAMNT_0019993049 /DNA_START=99 /DNA_END=476 /DNA_ORIENTATION=+